jgi:hypothetical protein
MTTARPSAASSAARIISPMTPPDARAEPVEAAGPASRRRWASALHPVLFAAYPVLFLWSQNVAEADPADIVVPLLVTTGAAAVLTLLLGLVLGDVRRAAIAVTPVIVGLLVYGHAARVGQSYHVPVLVQQAAWVTVIVIGAVLALRLSAPRVQRLGAGLTRVAAILIVITLVLIVPAQLGGGVGAGLAADDAALATTTSAPRRDVYWFIFDRYGSDRSLELQYGVHNDLTPWLREHGFTVPGSYANYVKTSLSLATTMQMTHLADMSGVPGPASRSHAFLYAQIRSSLVARQFQALGYRYVNIGSWWEPTRSSPLADENLHTPGPSEFESSLIEASALPALLRRAGVVVDARERHWENNQFGLDAALGMRDEPGPKFVFAHILLPHPPYVHAVDGSFRTRAASRGVPRERLFADQLAYGNSRIREIVDGLLALPEPDRPIIILQADEGPEMPQYTATSTTTWDWNEATTEELEIKFGILNAWFVPGDRPVGLYDGQTSINTFPLLFRDYFGLDYPLLPDRVFASRRYDLPYDQIEITDRLPAP